MTGGQFEIRTDGTPRTYRELKDYATEATRQRRGYGVLAADFNRRFVVD